jgi:hypothetical protein
MAVLSSSHPLSFDEADEFVWDKTTGRYRYRTGASKGQFAPRTAVLALTRSNIQARSQELIDLGDSLSNGDIDLLDFQLSAAKLLKRIHLQSAILGKGGIDQMTDVDYLRVARALKIQYYDGKDPKTGKPFGLKHLANDIRNGTVSPAQLNYRLSLYAKAGSSSYWAAYQAAEKQLKPYGIRSLGRAEHCADCLQYAALLPQPIEKVILPGTRCRCGPSCQCSIKSLTLEEAIARGMRHN